MFDNGLEAIEHQRLVEGVNERQERSMAYTQSKYNQSITWKRRVQHSYKRKTKNSSQNKINMQKSACNKFKANTYSKKKQSNPKSNLNQVDRSPRGWSIHYRGGQGEVT